MIGVLGGGAWGTALAQVAAAGGRPVHLWARNAAVVSAINERRENSLYLPGIPLDPAIRASDDLAWVAGADLLLIVTPSQAMRSVLERLDARPRHLILCAKGIEAGTMRLMHEAAHEACPAATISVLSGPTFASEVARGLPAAVTLACADQAAGAAAAALLARATFRPYLSDDIVGAEIGGAVKNVLAIACGVVEGRGLGLNARAALISRGFAEMTRFGIARGARAETLSGLSGLGDLVLTCSSIQSRNFALGMGLGRGESVGELLGGRRAVAEGAYTAPVLAAAAAAAGVDMPITQAVCRLLSGVTDANSVVDALLARPLRREHA